MTKSRVGSEYLPLIDEEMSRLRFLVRFSRVAWFTVSLPFLAFLFCVYWSVIYNFEKATFTHCKVYNVLPSVSAAIGHYRPQRNVWRFAIAIQATIRAFIFLMYRNYYREALYKWAITIANIAQFTYAVENLSLVTLSFWSSNENYTLHKASFVMFLITSQLHMIIAYYILNKFRSGPKDVLEAKSLMWKWRALMMNVTSLGLALYFFYRHNKYCEPLVYSLFALAEYMVVLSNMLFHLTAVWDFGGRSILVSTNGFRLI